MAQVIVDRLLFGEGSISLLDDLIQALNRRQGHAVGVDGAKIVET